MSGKVTGWVLDQEIGNPARKLVLVCLADAANEDGSNAYPSKKTLAKYAEVTPRSVQRHLRALEADGLIEGVPRVRENGSATSTEYRILVPWGGETNCPPPGDTGVSPPETRVSPPDPSLEPSDEENPSLGLPLEDSKATTRGAHECPKDFAPTAAHRELHLSLELPREIEWYRDEFVDWFRDKGTRRKRWGGSFSRWLRRAKEHLEEKQANAAPTGEGDSFWGEGASDPQSW